MASQRSTGIVFSDRYLQHNSNPYRLASGNTLPFVEPVDHPSNPRLVERTKKLLDYTGLSAELERVEPYPATPEDLAAFHPLDYVERIREISASGGGDAGQGAPIGADSYEIALLAAGGVMAAVDAVMRGRRSAVLRAGSPARTSRRGEQGARFLHLRKCRGRARATLSDDTASSGS